MFLVVVPIVLSLFLVVVMLMFCFVFVVVFIKLFERMIKNQRQENKDHQRKATDEILFISDFLSECDCSMFRQNGNHGAEPGIHTIKL